LFEIEVIVNKMKNIKMLFWSIITLGLPFMVVGQKIVATLPPSLSETSGLCFLNDTVFVTLNDSGNEPKLFFLKLDGTLIHKVTVSNATNVDWEDITTDGKGTLYVADIGNNKNNRVDLCVYKINAKDILNKKEVKAEKISFSYPNQSMFPPEDKDKHFDAEAMAFYNDSLYIFTKCRAKPYDGKSFTYALPTEAGTQVAKQRTTLSLKGTSWMQNSVTSAEVLGDKLYLLTYTKLLIYNIENNKLKFHKRITFNAYTQKEAVAVSKTGVIYLTDEFKKLIGGGTLMKL
jgi:hypothetical protein